MGDPPRPPVLSPDGSSPVRPTPPSVSSTTITTPVTSDSIPSGSSPPPEKNSPRCRPRNSSTDVSLCSPPPGSSPRNSSTRHPSSRTSSNKQIKRKSDSPLTKYRFDF